MTAIAPSSPMSFQVGETTLRMMSAASLNSRPRSSQLPNRCQMIRRAPWTTDGMAARPNNLMNPSMAPNVTMMTAAASMASEIACAAS